MKKKVAIILNSLAIVLVFACTIALSFAWYTNSNDIDVSLQGGSAGGYFRGGSGTATDPYEIANSRHMYNFAWLQNNGKYVDSKGDQTKMYFELVNADGNNGVIDMEGVAIPPIGNDDLPFIGEFNGNGCTISNLIVSTHYDVIYNGDVLREVQYEFSNAVGLFGMTGTGSVIKNFILNDPIVEVYGGNDTIYDASGAKVVGIAIGYVENIASSIGIIGGTLANRRQENYSSYNNIIGSMSETAKGNMNITGETTSGGSGGDIGYFVPDKILEKITTYKNETVTPKPHYDASGKFLYENFGKLTVDNNTVSTIQLNANQLITANNPKELGDLSLGSFSIVTGTGGSDYIQKAENSSSYLKGISTIYYYKNGVDKYVKADFPNATPVYIDDRSKNDANDAEIQQVLSDIKYVEDGKTTYLTSLNSVLDFGSSKKAGSYSLPTVYEDGTVSSTNTSESYNSCVSINIASASPDNPSKVLLVAAVSRSTNARVAQVIDSAGNLVDEMYIPGYNEEGNTKTKINNAYACYFNITSTGKYYIVSKSGRITFYYVSVSGVETGQESTGTYEEDKMISGIDFITSDVTIVQTEGEEQYQFTNISDINPTNTFVYTKVKASFNSNMNGVTLYFKREDETISALLIEIYPNKDNLTTTGSGTCTITVVDQDLVLE